MAFNLQYLTYRRPFERPMKAAWGTWAFRNGLLLRLNADDGTPPRFGEIAPLPAFGSESLETAKAYLVELGQHPTNGELQDALLEAPVATASGLAMLLGEPKPAASARTAALFLLGEFQEFRLEHLAEEGFTTYKVKLGLDKPDKEWELLTALVERLQPGHRLRLDPNQGWTEKDWRFWKNQLHELANWVEFLEEPFPPGLSMKNWLEAAEDSPVPLALDESLAGGSLIDWCESGWPGYWIIKPSLLGDPGRWMSPLSKYRKKVVISSVFETGIGLGGLISLAGKFPNRDHGLGTQAWFNDDLSTPRSGAILTGLDTSGQEEIWNRLSVG